MPPHLAKPGIYMINKASSHMFSRLMQAFQHSQCHYLRLISHEKTENRSTSHNQNAHFYKLESLLGIIFPYPISSYLAVGGTSMAQTALIRFISLGFFLKLLVRSNFCCYRLWHLLSRGAVFQRSVTPQVTVFPTTSLPD